MTETTFDRRFVAKAGAMSLFSGLVARSYVRAKDWHVLAIGLLIWGDGPDASLSLVDPETGGIIFTFATEGEPTRAWGTTLPGVGIVQTDHSLTIVDGNDGSAKMLALPDEVAANILPKSIQFRGSNGIAKALLGTAGFGADTFMVDLITGERSAVIGLLNAETPPVSLSNVALARDDRHLLVWDGRTTWIVDLEAGISRTLGTVAFTFSAGFDSTGEWIAYSQQLASGKTELRVQNIDGSADHLLFESSDILVSLWLPERNAMLLDERSDEGGALQVYDFESDVRRDLLAYKGATNIVQFEHYGEYGLVGIEGEKGRDWYQLSLRMTALYPRIVPEFQDTEVSPGFDFHSSWAVAFKAANETETGAILALSLGTANPVPMIEGIGTDAQVSNVVVALSGAGAIVTIDSFTELAVHYLDFELQEDHSVDLSKGGTAVISPDGQGFAVSHDLNTGGVATVVYDAAGQEQVTIQGRALAWI